MNRELILNMHLSIDGFVADLDGKIDWVFRNSTEESRQWVVERMSEVGLHAMGNQSYQSMADFWPTAQSPFAPPMNAIPKAVFSRSGEVSRPNMEKSIAAGVEQSVLDSWQNPTVGGADLAADIQRLKAEGGKPIQALGGANFATSLIAAQLVDVFRLVVHPVALGTGLTIFAGLENPLHLKLEDLKQFKMGIVIKTYRPIYNQ